jgi:hypothetical protein
MLVSTRNARLQKRCILEESLVVRVFFSYSHKDEAQRNQLESHLATLKRQGVISTWHDRRIGAGKELDKGISDELEIAEIILFLVSSDFLASDYCYDVEMTRALERSAGGSARVIPVILRPCDWHHAPFGRLRASPKDGRPVTKWADPDDAYLDIARDIRTAAGEVANGQRPAPNQPVPAAPLAGPSVASSASGPRSSNLRLRQTFTDHDRDKFIEDAYQYMARFFDNSIAELAARHPGITGDFKAIDTTKFNATLYREGKLIQRCQIRIGGHFGNGISLALGSSVESNAINDTLSIEAADQALYLRPMMYRRSEGKLSMEGAAEYYWAIFIEPLQR